MFALKIFLYIIAVVFLTIFSLFRDYLGLTLSSMIIWPSECFDFYSFIIISVIHNFFLLGFLILFFSLEAFIFQFSVLYVHFNNFLAQEMEIKQVLDSNLMKVLVFSLELILFPSFFLTLLNFNFELRY